MTAVQRARPVAMRKPTAAPWHIADLYGAPANGAGQAAKIAGLEALLMHARSESTDRFGRSAASWSLSSSL